RHAAGLIRCAVVQLSERGNTEVYRIALADRASDGLIEKIMTDAKNPLGLKKIHHVEFYVGNAKQAEFYYRKAFGFSRAAYMGLETGNREVTSYVMQQNRVNFILTTPLSPEHPGAEHIKQHGDGVHDIAFQVEDADHAFNEAVRRGAKPVEEPHDHGDENGMVRHASIATYGDTIHSFLSYTKVPAPQAT